MNAREKTATNTLDRRADSASKVQKPEFSHSIASPISQILHLQRTIGNRAVQRLLKSGVIQQKIMHSNALHHQKIIQRKEPTVAEVQSICKGVVPSPPVPKIENTIAIKLPVTVLGPFARPRWQQCRIVDTRTGKWITNLYKHYQELKNKDEPEHRKIIGKIDTFIGKELIKNKNLTTEDFNLYVFGFRKAPKSAVGAETKMLLLKGETLKDYWQTIGEIIKKPKYPNPFYNWAALFHEEHHSRTAKKGFTIKAEQELVKLKQDILKRPAGQFTGASPARVNKLKKGLSLKKTPLGIYKYILGQSLLVFDMKLLKKSMKTLYNIWGKWISQTINLAKEELASYCISWVAIRRAIDFIRLSCPPVSFVGSARRSKRRR